MPRLRSKRALLLTVLSVSVSVLFSFLVEPLFLVNFTDSVPLGVYRLSPLPQQLRRGMYVALPPPPAAVAIAHGRTWFRPEKMLLKQIAGLPGDTVCSVNRRLLINGRDYGPILPVDKQGVPFPARVGCQTLGSSEVFLLGPNSPWTFDSRYFGTVSSEMLQASATPLVTPIKSLNTRQ